MFRAFIANAGFFFMSLNTLNIPLLFIIFVDKKISNFGYKMNVKIEI